MSDNRPSRYVEVADDGSETVVYRASSLGGCDRAMVAYARGHVPRPHPKWFQEVLDEGTAMEDSIDAMWVEKSGRLTIDKQREYELTIGVIEGRRVIIRCHPDGMQESGKAVREYKKFRPSTWGRFVEMGANCNEYYPWQVSIEMLVTGAEWCEFVGGEFVDGEIVSVLPYFYTEPPIPLIKIKQTIARVERLVNEGYGAEEVACTKRFPCPFWPLHDDMIDGGPVRVEVQAPVAVKAFGQMQSYASSIAAAEANLKALKARKGKAETELRAELSLLGLTDEKKLTINGVSVTRVKFDTAEVTKMTTRKAFTTDYFKIGKEDAAS